MSDIAELLVEQANRLFAQECGRVVLDQAADGTWPEGLWTAVESAGLTDVLVAPEHGGVGAEMAEATMIARIAAEHAAPVPLVETVVARWLLSAHGLAIGTGPATVAIASLAGGDQRRLSGVGWACEAQTIAFLTMRGGGWAIAALGPGDIRTSRYLNLADEPRDAVEIVGGAVAPGRLVDVDFGVVPVAPEYIMALLRAAQISGAMNRLLAITTAYANERVQFGRPIAKFQAIQQAIVEMAGHVAATAVIVDNAAGAFATGQSELMIAAAKARASEGAGRVAAISHQVLGAMGYTREHDLHWYTRRLWAWRDEAGSETYWQAELARMVMASDGDLWQTLTGSPEQTPNTGKKC